MLSRPINLKPEKKKIKNKNKIRMHAPEGDLIFIFECYIPITALRL
jgi:hypothetical protein